jgi:RHS repeat-associated protein
MTRLISTPTVRNQFVRGVLAALLVFLFGGTAAAQQSTVTFSENFQSYGKSKKPAGWIDTKIGSLNAKPRGYFKTRIDPTQDKKGSNVVFGSMKSSGHHDDDYDADDDDADTNTNKPKRDGYFAIYQPAVFSAAGRFEVTGRLIRVGAKSRAGLTVLSGYPEKDRYYIINEEVAKGATTPTLRLGSFGAGTPTGKLDSKVSLTPGKWYRFRIATDNVGGSTNIKAKFWLDGTAEPEVFSIEATDTSANRLTAGRFGVWVGGGEPDDDNYDKGDDESSPPAKGTYVDDLNAKSPVDTGLPTIAFYESGTKLDTTKRTDFGRNAAVEIRVADELSTFTYTATLDGAAYTSLTPIATEGPHVVKVRAVDAVGNVAESQVSILVDKTAPSIALLESGQPLADNTKFKRTAAVEIKVADALTAPTHAAKLDGNTYTSLTPISAEGPHVLLVEAIDAVGNKSTRQVRLVIDLTAPAIAFFESGRAVDSSTAKFKVNPAIEIKATDALPVTVTATLNGAGYDSLTPITIDGHHTIVATAVDEAGNTKTETLLVLVDKVAPVVVLREGTTVLDPSKTAVFARDAGIAVEVTDATSQPEWAAKLDNVAYTSGTLITTEGTHAVTVHAADETGNVTDVTLPLLIDKTAPAVEFREGTTKLDPRADNLFRRDVAIEIIASDAISTPEYTATLDGTRYDSLTPITAEGTHVIAVHVTDTAGNVFDAELRFVIDKTKPAIALSENGEAFAPGSHKSLGRDARVVITVTDNQPGVSHTAKLDGSDYTSDSVISAEGPHTLTVNAVDAAGNESDATVTLLIDKTGPAIQFFETNVELLATEPKHKFKVLPKVEIRIADEHSTFTPSVKLNGVDYTSLTPIPEGKHTLTASAVDALGNASEKTIALLVDLTAPVIVLKEGTNVLPVLPAFGGIFAHDLTITADVKDLSETEVTAVLDDAPFSLSVPVAEEGPHTLKVTAIDELQWPATVTSTFTIDKTAPKVTIRESGEPLLDGASFARDVTLLATAEDITQVTYKATLDGADYTLGNVITADGTHTIVVTGTDAAGNVSAPQSVVFHIERANPEVRLRESGQSFPDGKSFARDIVATIDVTAATSWTSDVKIDGADYTLGQPYGVEGQHRITVIVTTAARRSTEIGADFEIDKTRPTIRLIANGAPMFDDQTFSADFTPSTEADDNLTKPPVVVVTLDGQTLAPTTVVSEEKEHTIVATATDRAGNVATSGPFKFVLDKTDPVITVKVDDKPLLTGDKFKTAITPVIKAEDLTKTEISATLDGVKYDLDTPITEDGAHTLVVKAVDRLNHETPHPPITFVIDKTPPVVTVLESDAPFVSGSKYRRAVTPVIRIVDTTQTTITATLDGNVYQPDSEISSEGHHELNIVVTDELGWSFVVPPIAFTIDNTEPTVEVREGTSLLVTGTIFNRDVRPEIVITDATTTTTDATLDGVKFDSGTLVTTEGLHTLAGKVTDELGLFTPILPIEFTIDKTAPVVVITEAGVPFADNSLLNHDAVPQATITDITAVEITAKLDGADYKLGTAITAEGPHTLVWSARDAAGWTTRDATIRFVIDKTAPDVDVTDGDAPLVSGLETGRSVRPVITVTDISTYTIEATLDGVTFNSGTEVAAEGTHTLLVTVTDAAGWSTVVPPITFLIDKTAPNVRVLESGQELVSGTKFNRGVLPQIVITDGTATTTAATLNDAEYLPDTLIETEGTLTLKVRVTDRGGNFTDVPSIAFVIDRTAPVVAITESGQPLTNGSAFMRSVKPEIAIQDITQTHVDAKLDDQQFQFGTELTEEKRYSLNVTVTDELQWSTTVPTISFAIDKTPPVVELVEDGKPLTSGSIFNRAITPQAVIDDVTETTVKATLNGVDYELGTEIEAEGEYTLEVKVTDQVGLSFTVPAVTFRIDTTKPVISFLTPANNANLADARVLVTGNADDAVAVDVSGVPAEVDLQAKRFTIPAFELLEGPNTIVAVGTDAAGNVSDPVSVDVTVDTRAPEVTITSPVTDACIATRELAVSGTLSDPHISSVKVQVLPGTAPAIDATLSADRRTWNANVTFPAEGKFVIAVTARDNGGHESVTTAQVRVDQTKPRIEITDAGAPFASPNVLFVNRAVTPVVRVVDADPNAKLTLTLDGAPFISATPVVAERAAHYELKATAEDCAGNKADDAIVRFVIDVTAPQFLSHSPANGASIGAVPTIGGTVSPDVVAVIVEETGVAATVANGSFTFGSVATTEGGNRFTLVAVDRAGNRGRADYSFTLKTTAPTISITENGSEIVNGTIYNREVAVDVRSNEADAVITATHNGQPFTSSTVISANGTHAIHATARDAFGHTSQPKDVTFTIDRNAPVVTITEPADESTVTSATVRVRGTVSGDPVSASIDGAPLTVTGGAFDTEVALEIGSNQIVVNALDAAGNSGTASVDVTRGGGTLGLILNSPVTGLVTNRRTTTVAGQVLTPAGVSHVKVNGVEIPIDAAGAFRKTDFPLTEGLNTITAIVQKGAAQGSVSVTVTGDFTPPAVLVTESGNALEDETRFATRADITVIATDGGQSIAPVVLLDAANATSPLAVTATGGHTLVAIATDAAGNETRVERTFFIGGNSGGTGCSLTDFDPANNALVTSDTVTLVGRTGGAAGVKVNGIAALVSNGSFSATVNLPNEGANTVNITCTDANSTATGTPVTITLTRATGAPSIDITSPANDSPSATETITVSGTISGEVSQVLVNGAAATINGNTFSAANVRLTSGLNVIVARARNAAGRTATDSVRVTWLKNLPAIAITSPAAPLTVRAATVDISGTWSNLDPSSVTVGSNAAQTTITSDTSGTFRAAAVALAMGPQTIVVRGTDRLGRIATANIEITRADGKPSIAISTPSDNQFFATNAGDSFTVTGSFSAAAGAAVEVNGVAATLDGSNFTASVPFSSLPTGLTLVVARVTEPEGNFAIDSVRISKFAAAPGVVEAFPAADATNADSAALPLVLFSAPMDRASVRNAFRLENAAGTAISGDVVLDRDVLTFAPAVLLTAGERYTIRIAASAADLAGNTMAAAFSSAFTVAATAPAVAPSLNAYAPRACEFIDLTGTAPADAQLRVTLGNLSFNVTATATGAFTFRLPLSGRSGYQVARVRIVGSDGSLSPAAEARFEVDCTGPAVTNATYDRTSNVLTVTFSKAIDVATITTGANGSARIQLTDGTFVGGTVAALASQNSVSITPAQNLTAESFTLSITTAVKDTNGAALTSPFARAFMTGEPELGDGGGYISGEVFDADTGRPLPGANITIEMPSGPMVAIADNRGRYLRQLPEGAHTIRASADGFTTVWRQIIVRAGAGVIPTDIRLTRRGTQKSGNGDALVLAHEQPLALPAELRIPAGAVSTGSNVTLTTLGAQSLAGLLPLGWSPLASAEIVSNAPALSGAELTFTVPAQEITSATQTLTAVRYYDDRDEWRVVTAVVPIANNKATIPVAAPGAYALVYGDKGPRLQAPPAPNSGGVLAGVVDPCTTADPACPPLAAKETLKLDPPIVLPSQRTVATLRIEGSGASLFPSGTAVQAYVDEELRLADGTRDVVAPFATDLLLYRTPSGDLAEAEFHLAPSSRAAEVVLEVGYEHIKILPYPERLDRGTLIGPEGGRVPADDRVTVDIPAGATSEALRASANSIADFASYGSIPGYRIVGGVTLSLTWGGATQGDESTPVELTKPARATFTIDASSLPSQLILAEVVEGTPYGRVFRLASQMTKLEGLGETTSRYSTKNIDRAVLPVDGIIREGRYLLLAPDAPIAFATGTVHLGNGGPATANARVLTPSLGVVDLTRITGIFNVPVPAAVFSLVPRTPATGDGAAYTHPAAAAIDAVINVGALAIVAQPPAVAFTVHAHGANGLVEVSADGATGVTTNTSVKASFSPGLDPQSVRVDSMTVIDDTDGTIVKGRAAAQGSTAILWTLEPGTQLRADGRYTAVVSPNVRGINGTPVGGPPSATFSTVSTLTSPNVDPSKIRITMPDANGRAQIIGAPGALAEHWNAVAVRRFRDFSNRPQDSADSQRSFLIELGTGNDPLNRVTIADEIYLQIINNAGSVAAIVQLGPFTTDDGRGFVARPEKVTSFTTADNIGVTVPAGAFEEATIVRVDPAPVSAVADVPGISEELDVLTAFKIDFKGVAKKRLDVKFPAPANLPANKNVFVGFHGMSAQGPRIMLVDLLRRDGGNLTTVHTEGDTSSIRARGSVASEAIVNPTVLRDMLLGIDRGAILIGFGFNTSINFISFAPPPHPPDFFIPPIKSMYYASFAAERDRILVPVSGAGAFNIVGVDPGTGLEVFNAPYNEIGPGEPTSPTAVTLPSTNEMGPYPVFASPGRAEVLNVDAEEFTDGSIRNIIASYNGTTVSLSNASTPLPANTRVEVVNLRSATTAVTEDFAAGGLSIPAKRGDRLVFLIGDQDVDPASNLTVVFSEPLDTSGDLNDHIKLLVRDPSVAGSTFQEVPRDLINIETNSGDRRVLMLYRGGFQRGKTYRVELRNTLKDIDTGGLQLRLGQKRLPDPPPPPPPATPPPPAGGPVPNDMHIDFTVRAPKGLVDTFNLSSGSVRDLAMVGNVLLVSALDAGIYAYDVSNPMTMSTAPNFARIAPPIGSDGATWGVTVDLHNRIYATAVSPMYGVVRSYRLEDLETCLLAGSCPDPMPFTVQRGNAIIAWRTGINVGMPLASMIVGGWPEATPRKINVVTRDEDPEVDSFKNLVSGGADVGNGFQSGTLNLTSTGGVYDKQRVTVINTTRDYRWSADVPSGGSVAVTVVGQPDDELRIVRNASTIGVVSLFGFGVGVYDLNAVDANYRHVLDSSWERLEDTYVLSDGEGSSAADCDKAAQAQMGRSCDMGSLRMAPDATLSIKGDTASVLVVEQNRGLLHLTVAPQPGFSVRLGRPGSMIFAERINIPGLGRRWFGHPRLNQLRRLYQTASGREPMARYANVAVFHRGGERYALVTGYEYGVLVVKLDPVMKASSLVDVIWIPSGAQSIRVSDANQLAVVVDGNGRVLLVNLAGIDETDFMDPELPCTNIDCEWALFPTAKAAITGPSAGSGDVGADDPRIVWKSPDSPSDPLVFGTLAPIFDGDTGFVYTGNVTQKKMRVVSAVDPHVRFVGRTGVGASPEAMKRLNQIVPLGIKPPDGAVAGENGSLAAFQLQVLLPAGIQDSLPAPMSVELDTEPLIGVASPQLPEPLPRSRLRQTGSRAATGFQLMHDGPEPGAAADKLRFQRGWNRMVTPWIVAIADPRAAEDYDWGSSSAIEDKEKAGCFACERPEHLKDRNEPDVFELYTAGRYISARPDPTVLTGPYEWLGEKRRLGERVNTVQADTVRPIPVLVAAQAPPAARGMLEETTYVHSGEVEAYALDFDAGGRADWNVVLDRTYRSRTLYQSPLGVGWDSSIFRRLRLLPSSEVEYRDGGEVWTFKPASGGAYTSPAGLAVSLKRIDTGWMIVDQKYRITTFDSLGRMVRESDEFFNINDLTSGNVIHYMYGSNGLVSAIIDPIGRQTKLKYYADTTPFGGLLEEIEDWHASPRKIKLHYDTDRRLTKVELPDVVNTSSSRPEIRYTYTSSGGSYNDKVELRANLETITDPKEAVGGGSYRVKFEYGTGGITRDRVTKQTWGTGESATMSYTSATEASVTDVLGQERKYVMTENDPEDVSADRAHITQLTETSVPVWTGSAFGQLPSTVPTGTPTTSPENRVWTFGFTDGMETSASLQGVSSTTLGYTSAPGGAGKIIASSTTAPASAGSSSDPWMPSNPTIAKTFVYQSGSNAAAFLKAVQTGTKKVETPEPHRGNVASLQAANDAVDSTSEYEKYGLVKSEETSGGTDAAGAGSKTTTKYFPETAPKHARFLPQFVTTGASGAELVTEYQYPTDSQTIEIDPRGVRTTTDFDAWNRPKRIEVRKPGDPLVMETRYEYDATGRIVKETVKQDGSDVTTFFSYDVMGRRTTTVTNNIATIGSSTSTMTYDLPSRKITTSLPGGATSATDFDKLGRPVSTFLATGSSPIQQKYAYDLAGNLVYTTDTYIATATAYDSHGRAIATRGSDGIITTIKRDDAGNPEQTKVLTPGGSETVAESTASFADSGRLQGSTTKVDGSTTRSSAVVWDGGGRITGNSVGNRAVRLTFDSAGKPLTHAAGAGSATALSDTFTQSQLTSHAGALPMAVSLSEKGSSPVTTALQRDTGGKVTQGDTGTLQWTQKYDELGNVVSTSEPGRPVATRDVDARGNVIQETLPDGSTNQFAYDGNGAQSTYADPSSEATNTSRDLIGRPVQRTFADGTSEIITWEGPRVKSVTDRQGRTLTFSYNSKSQLYEILHGGTVIDRIGYDDAGRMVSWTNAASETTFGPEFDLEGRPKRTKQKRFKDNSGFTTGELLDEFEQIHTYNEHGERTFATMPVKPGQSLAPGWTTGIGQVFDAMGNITTITRGGGTLMTATYRNEGRPDTRTITTAGGSSFVRTYSYDPTTGLLMKLSVTNSAGEIAGSEVTYDGLQTASARLLGVASSQRYQHWSYDSRGRVRASLSGTNATASPAPSVPGSSMEALSPAGFRGGQDRVSQLNAPTRALLASKNVDTTKIDPPSASFSEQSGHKIAQMTKGPEVLTFGYQGAERVDDGRFTYEFDVKGRLIRATEKSTVAPIRGIAYSYSGAGRLIGRRAEYASTTTPAPADWKLEDRPFILAADGLPAETTFVWDPVTDRLVAIFKAGATPATDANGGLLKQIIHGGSSYDDPLETATIDPATGGVTHLYPIYDEAAGGSLQAIVNTTGEVIARNLSNDPYGSADVALAGAAVDGVNVAVKKTGGTIDTVTVTLHSTETLTESSVATGARLAVVDGNGALVRTAAGTPQLDPDDAFAVKWSLTAAQWAALTSTTPETVEGTERFPVALSVAAGNSLRASNWGSELPVLPAPDWVQASKTVFTSSDYPVEVRESLSMLATFVGGVGADETQTTKLYEVDALALLGNPGGADELNEDIVSARMHAHPFTEPVTRLNYVRARWYDPESGSFLSPDPEGYVDSSNLYAFAGGDPVNGRDPTGREALPSEPMPTPKAPPTPRPPGKVIPFPKAPPAVVKPRVGHPIIVVALILYDLCNWTADHIDRKADEYVEEQRELQRQIREEAAERRRRNRKPNPAPTGSWDEDPKPGAEAAPEAEAGNRRCNKSPWKYDRDRWVRGDYKKNREKVLERDKVCQYCGDKPATSADHVVSAKDAEAAFGAGMLTEAETVELLNELCNLLGVCSSCNSSKSDKMPGNIPGETWVPSNPSARAIEIMRRLGTWID